MNWMSGCANDEMRCSTTAFLMNLLQRRNTFLHEAHVLRAKKNRRLCSTGGDAVRSEMILHFIQALDKRVFFAT
jgi:hypothetical protein